MKKQKLEEIDALRAFAFLAVVLQHAIGHYAYLPESRLADGVLLGMLLLLAKFAVPVFIFITGLVLFYNYEGGVHYGRFVLKRCKDILLPYAPWVVLFGVAYNSLTLGSWEDWKQLGLLLITGKASYHLWYVVMIFQLYLIFPALRYVILPIARRIGAGTAGAAALTILAAAYIWLTGETAAISNAFGTWHIPVLSDLFTAYIDRNSLLFIYYFIMGAAAGLYMERWKAWLQRRKAAIITVYGVYLAVMFYVVVSHFRFQPDLVIHYDDTLLLQPLMASFLIVSIPAMHLAAAEFTRWAGGKLRRLSDLIGRHSYTAYLAHALVLGGSTWIADLLLPGANTTLRTILSFALCASGSVLTAWLLSQAAALLRQARPAGRTQKNLSPPQ
ncbi:acyltransferase [Paenibacillus thalictri]|uniref:Acyltransferase n=1 Tax=Paenibacillus thalictri TaxID=2527873 RepID=A0A4Q9DHN7_9BACL|nr:acyltransferase [Paenibacillus thalictri]TBL71033.1 acyltransferase [Paenibacillus thalictri]